MSHVLMVMDPITHEIDLAEDENGFVALTAGLETMCLISLFTRKRAPSDQPRDPPFGWWGDSIAEVPGDQIGSHLWLLQRANLTVETLRFAKYYSEVAFAWMIEDEIAKSIVVTTESQNGTLAIGVNISRPDGEQWSDIWKVHSNAL